MAIINCECCNKKISEDSLRCINCGHPITEKKRELLFLYEYKGQTINSPWSKDDAEKLDELMKIKKVSLHNKTYTIKDFICNAHGNDVYVIIDDEE